MKTVLAFFCLCFILQSPTKAQTKQKAEKEFLKQLNIALKNSKQQHSAYEGSVMTIDSAFAINKEGILSVTVRYTNDSSFVRTRMTAPVSKIDTVRYDFYLILEYKDTLVTFYQSDPGSNDLKETNKGGWFHVGAPLPEDFKYQENLQKALDNVLKYYR